MRDVGMQRRLTGPCLRFVLAVLMLVLPWSPVKAENNPVSEGWSFELTPFVWAMSLDGDVTVRGQKSSVDLGFNDLIEHFNVGAMIAGEARNGRFGAFALTTYAKLSDNASGEILKLKADAKTLWLEGGVYYRLGPWIVDEAASGEQVTVTLDPYVGARYTYLDLNLDFKGRGGLGENRNLSGDQDWVDPIIGARTILDLSDHWSITAFGDIGGFNVGSDFSWQAVGLVGYSFGLFGDDDARVMAGYRALHQDYKNGNGNDEFKWDVTLHGPVFAMAVQF